MTDSIFYLNRQVYNWACVDSSLILGRLANFRSFVAMPKRLFDNLDQSRSICYVKFTLREKLNLTNTPGLVQITKKSFRHRNKASEVGQGYPNISKESTQAQL